MIGFRSRVLGGFLVADRPVWVVWRQMVLAMSFLAIVGGAALVADRGSRRLLLRRVRQVIGRRTPSPPPSHRLDDISATVGRRRRRHREAGAFALAMLLVAVALPIPIWPYGSLVAFAAAWVHGRAMRWIGLAQAANDVRVPRLRGWPMVPGASSIAMSMLMLAGASTMFFAAASAQEVGPGTADPPLVENTISITRILGVVLIVMAPRRSSWLAALQCPASRRRSRPTPYRTSCTYAPSRTTRCG